MPGRGPAPAKTRRRTNVPERGDWEAIAGMGWQHGDLPMPPTGLLKTSRETWRAWMTAWYAAHWRPEDLPGLRQAIRLWDQVERGEYVRAAELRLWLDTWGISPKGQQDRRWSAPAIATAAEPAAASTSDAPYGHLRVVGEG